MFLFHSTEVDDFHTVDHEALSILNISATQELIKQIGIATKNYATNYELSVAGDIICESIVSLPISLWPDYVFSSSYNLKPLHEVKDYIEENHHLPGIPSAKEIDSTGVNLGEMNRLLLEKVEERTLYIIQQKHVSDKLIKENQALIARLESLENDRWEIDIALTFQVINSVRFVIVYSKSIVFANFRYINC